MKNLIIYVLLILCFSQCNRRVTQPSLITALPASDEHTAIIRAAGYGKNLYDISLDAEQRAFRAILFTGLPGGINQKPMVSDDRKTESKNTSFYNEFFQQKRYQDYVISNTPASEMIRVKGDKRMMCDISINLAGLRSYLEKNQVIRKFGY
jgi:hypothetical protein